MSVPAAKIIEQRSHLVPGKFKITEHFFEVPKDYSVPAAGTLRLFARSAKKHVVNAAPASAPSPSPPWLLYLQGGPGHECRSPQSYGFTRTFLEKGFQVLFLDQRGTGLSTPISASTLKLQGDTQRQAEYLKKFRADSIVRDCEAIRLALTEQQRAEEPEKRAVGKDEDWRKWSIVGQSFGGFCSLTYLSFFPEGLRESFIGGGLAPVRKDLGPDDVYKRLAKRVMKRNQLYYKKFPEDIDRVKGIVRYLIDNKVTLPTGGTLTPRRFLQMGINFGFHGGIESVHEKILRASNDLALLQGFSRGTAQELDSATAFFETNPIYFIHQESIYCQSGGAASNWSAQRILQQIPAFNTQASLQGDQPIYFTGEMVFSWMPEDYAELSHIKGVVDRLASDTDWTDLYDTEQLSKNEVPVYAAVYKEDMYVDYDLSLETAETVKGIQTLETNRIYHDGIRSKEDQVINQGLLAMREDVLD